jgi:RNA polymerase sigma-70 factor (ECF subfamily)
MSGREVGPVNEEDLVSLAASGDDAAFGELVRIHQHEVYTVALRMVSDRELAYDVAQEAFIRAWRAIGRFRGDAKFSTWMHRITVNTALTHRERRKRNRTDALDAMFFEPEADGLTPERGGESAAAHISLESALTDLADPLRAVVVLKDIYGWSHAEISEHLDISVTAAKVRLHRGRKALRDTLWEYKEDRS